MTATLFAFPVFGFFAASVVTLARLLAVVLGCSLTVAIVGLSQGTPLLHGLGLGLADLALSQVGYGLGLIWVAATRSPVAGE